MVLSLRDRKNIKDVTIFNKESEREKEHAKAKTVAKKS